MTYLCHVRATKRIRRRLYLLSLIERGADISILHPEHVGMRGPTLCSIVNGLIREKLIHVDGPSLKMGPRPPTPTAAPTSGPELTGIDLALSQLPGMIFVGKPKRRKAVIQ